MSLGGIIAFAGAFLGGSLAVVVLVKDRRSFAYRTLALGMAALALESFFFGRSLEAVSPAAAHYWPSLMWLATALVPSSWLLFSLAFARDNYKEYVTRWKWGVVGALVIPLSLVVAQKDSPFSAVMVDTNASVWVWPVSWNGYAFHIFFLLCAVFILVNLERTLKASTGGIRWRIKFTIVGIGAMFAARIYTSSQVLLFSTMDSNIASIDAGMVVLADFLVLLSMLRGRLRDVKFYVSQDLLYKSLTVLIVGGYLLAIGAVAAVARYLGATETFLHRSFFAVLGGVGLVVILLSDRLRYNVKWFVSRHFHHPRYDYRKQWTDFTQRTFSLLDSRDLCTAVVKTVAETVGVSSVSIWLLDESRHRPVLAASTSFFLSQEEYFKEMVEEVGFLALTLRDNPQVTDLDRAAWSQSRGDKPSHTGAPEDGRIRYCVPLTAGNEFLGILTLNERISGEPLTLEDFDLLKTIADQTAGWLLNHRLFERLGRARELEAFQTLSAFFVHDLKNVASTLSLMLQNLPAHYENPDFRADALRVMSTSVVKIKDMCGRLALLKDKIELKRRECDLNELVSATLAGLNGSLNARLVEDLRPLPKVLLDSEQIQKVLINLVLNAQEALHSGGEIHLTTGLEGEKVALAVADNGCGMSKEFMEKSLFHPFKTTKERGSGIGLFQSKMIVEAHHGWIEVESEEGRGSTFRVFLPLEQ